MEHKRNVVWLIVGLLFAVMFVTTSALGQTPSKVLPPKNAVLSYDLTGKSERSNPQASLLQQANGDLPVVSLAASSQLWPVGNANDGNPSTCWSSSVHGSANSTEWIAYWFGGYYSVNYIKLRPRYSNVALSFPVDFTVYYSDGSNWQPVYTYTSFPTPQRNDWIILPFATTVRANGILVSATKLGQDDFHNYVLQFAEVGAGYDSGFEKFTFQGNNGASLQNEIRGAGSSQFNPDKLRNWNYDIRRPLIAANATPGPYRNIYAPNIVLDGSSSMPHTWNIYFGGWDGTSDHYDRISLLKSTDDFLTFSANHVVQINKGSFEHVNNESVQKIGVNQWLMYYTTWPDGGNHNKPCYSTSANGLDWTPSAGTTSSCLTMLNYPDWGGGADVNGSNVLYYENGTYHLYFIDVNPQHPFGVHHATSGNGVNYTYQNTIQDQYTVVNGTPQPITPNDVKPFSFNGTPYYLMAGVNINNGVYAGTNSIVTNFPGPTRLFTSLDSNDANLTGVGVVSDGSRLYGVLYGGVAGPPSTVCCTNAIYAAWLQKKVLFINDYVRWGDIERAYGPDRIKLFMLNQVETGKFYVYDTDGTTLLYVSPRVTIRSGDIWGIMPPPPPPTPTLTPTSCGFDGC